MIDAWHGGYDLTKDLLRLEIFCLLCEDGRTLLPKTKVKWRNLDE